MSWTKFSEKLPSEHTVIVTDYEKVWIESDHRSKCWCDYETSTPGRLWMEITLPTVPLRPLHRCEDPVSEIVCAECSDDDNNSYLRVSNVRDGGFYTFHVNYCPFCGYSLKDKK